MIAISENIAEHLPVQLYKAYFQINYLCSITMKFLFRKLFLSLFLFSSSGAFSLSVDSAEVKVPTILHYTTPETDIGGLLTYSSLDTLLNDLEIINPTVKYFYNDLSNIGSATDPKLFSISRNCLTEFGNHSFDLYKWTPSTMHYYKTNKRFTNLNYHSSGGKEQQITITLAQNILKNWNAGIDFNRQGSPGFLTNGKTFITNFDFCTWYHLPNNRYHIFASATWNSIINKVDGGLANDSLYKKSNFSNNDLKGLSVFLIDAEQHVRNHIFSITHFYDLATTRDSVGVASPILRLTHHIEYERFSYHYSDNTSDTSFYANNYFATNIDDTLHYDKVTNKLSLQAFHTFNNFKPVHHAFLELTGGNQWFNYNQFYDTTITDYFTEAHLKTAGIKNRCTLDVLGKYILNGADEKNYFFCLKFQFPLIWGTDMNIGLQNEKQSPTLIQNFYQSNHFVWQNNFDRITSQQFFFQINLKKYNFSVAGTSTFIGRYIYYDSVGEPAQSPDSIQVSQLFIQKDFQVWKIHFNNSVWIQETNNDVVRIPEFNSHHALFFEDLFFKKKLYAQIGFDVHCSSGYYSNAYSPATSIFYQQNSEKTNGYPLIDLFVNFKIKTARLFFKYQNMGDGLVANNYLNTPHYPMPGGMIQFGVNWRFFD